MITDIFSFKGIKMIIFPFQWLPTLTELSIAPCYYYHSCGIKGACWGLNEMADILRTVFLQCVLFDQIFELLDVKIMWSPIKSKSAWFQLMAWHRRRVIIWSNDNTLTDCWTQRSTFYPLALQAEGVLSLPASVRLSVRPSVRPSVREFWLVRTITRHRFELESPNLHQTCILGYSQLVLKMEVIDLDLQGRFGHFDLKFLGIRLVCMITCPKFKLESPNLHQTFILGYSQLVLNIEVIDLDLQVHFGHFDIEF